MKRKNRRFYQKVAGELAPPTAEVSNRDSRLLKKFSDIIRKMYNFST